ncbi:hypothetical protein [Kineococcus terrestris]|uniref:hypothetical protein n=1 Tax=Kineococcus terrestris TaxID=2044856 RepID=UPI0034DAD74B
MSSPAGQERPHDGGHRPTHDDRPGRQATTDRAQDRLGVEHHGTDRRSVVERERNAFGGIKPGSAFFGWLTATGMVVLLTTLVAATGTAIGLSSQGGVQGAVDAAAQQAGADAGTIGVIGAVAVLVVLLVAYFCGGYVAGRMARFDGAKQGVAVWLWAVVIAVVVAVLAAVAGSQYDVLGQVNAFPRIPVDSGQLTTGAVLSVVAAAVVSLVGAVLGGVAGMRYHRKVDRAGLGR